MEPNFSVSVRFGSGSQFFRFGFRFSVFRAQGDPHPTPPLRSNAPGPYDQLKQARSPVQIID